MTIGGYCNHVQSNMLTLYCCFPYSKKVEAGLFSRNINKLENPEPNPINHNIFDIRLISKYTSIPLLSILMN